MTQPEKMALTSMDVVAEKREELKRCLGEAFPEVFAEGAIDFDQLKRVLSEWVDPGKERFGLTWPGKAECTRIIQQPSVATLKPAREESVNFDGSENVFVEGDNLEVLKLLQKGYFGKVKLIYIDPPYNTGNEFIYPDKYSETLDTYLEYTGQKDSEGRKFSTNTDASGRYHSRWLSMMYPRLYLARNLLREDGFIIVSIDDDEFHNLRYLLNEVFGEENLVGVLVFDRNRKNDAKLLSIGHEYMVVFARNKEYLRESNVRLRAPKEGVDEVRAEFERLRKLYSDDWGKVAVGLKEYYNSFKEDDPRKPLARYKNVDSSGPFRTDGDASWPGAGGPRYEVPHPKTGKPCKVPSRGWVWPTYERMKEEINKGFVVFGPDETTIPSVKRCLFEKDSQVMRSVIFSYAQKASQDFNEIFDGNNVFNNPKSFLDLERLINYLSSPGDLVLDFFAGSGTTAHGVWLSNRGSKLQRKFICVQLPELISTDIDAGRNALSLGYKTIADIARDRLRRAAKKMALETAGELALNNSSIDLGFKAFKLDRSNFKVWNGDLAADDLGHQIEMHIDHLSAASGPEDVLYELLLKAGFPLTTKVRTSEIAGKQVFSIQDGALLICLEKDITPELIDALAEANPLQVICLDEGFKGNDQLKANAVQTFKARAASQESEIVFKTV